MAGSMNPVRAYRETQIKTANQGKLIIMLYDEAIRQIDTAVSGLQNNSPKYDRVNNALVKAQELVTELMVSLDFDRGGDIAQGLFSLYVFFNRQLLDANIRKDPNPMKDVRTMLADLRTAWTQIAAKHAGTEEANSASRGVNIAG
jgi:flagellar secretion chaperone FliS